MHLVDALSVLKNGDLLLWKGKHWYSPIIRWWTKGRWAHCGIYYRDPVNGPCYIDSDFKDGVQIHPFEEDIPNAFQHTRCPWAQNMPKPVFDPLGEDYSRLDMLRCGFGLPANNGGYPCSEFAARTLRLGGWHFREDFNPSPNALSRIVAASGPDFQVVEID